MERVPRLAGAACVGDDRRAQQTDGGALCGAVITGEVVRRNGDQRQDAAQLVVRRLVPVARGDGTLDVRDRRFERFLLCIAGSGVEQWFVSRPVTNAVEDVAQRFTQAAARARANSDDQPVIVRVKWRAAVGAVAAHEVLVRELHDGLAELAGRGGAKRERVLRLDVGASVV